MEFLQREEWEGEHSFKNNLMEYYKTLGVCVCVDFKITCQHALSKKEKQRIKTWDFMFHRWPKRLNFQTIGISFAVQLRIN